MRALRLFWINLILSLILAACQAAQSPTVVTTPQVLRVAYTPTLSWMQPGMHLCAEAQRLALNVIERSAGHLTFEQADLLLRWGEPTEVIGEAYVIGQERLLVVAHPSNPLPQLSLADLIRIHQGQINQWNQLPGSSDLGKIQLWSTLALEDITQIDAQVLGEITISPEAYVAPDPAALRSAVAAEPTALGFIPAHWLDTSVRTVSISGLPDAQAQFPLLALLPERPTAAQQTFLGCLQRWITPSAVP